MFSDLLRHLRTGLLSSSGADPLRPEDPVAQLEVHAFFFTIPRLARLADDPQDSGHFVGNETSCTNVQARPGGEVMGTPGVVTPLPPEDLDAQCMPPDRDRLSRRGRGL